MNIKKYKVIQDPIYGYRRLDPVPENKELVKFYQRQYYELVRKGGRFPELRRLMTGGEEAEHERTWLRTTFYTDIFSVLSQYVTGKRILDIGCGNGEFIYFLKENGFETVGIEPSAEAVELAKSRGLIAYNFTLEDFIEYYKSNSINAFDAITLLNVLEHVPDPVHIIEITKKILNSGGIICIRVPNDFSELQLSAQKQLNKDPWWIAIPDHVNYFNFETLFDFLEKLGFEIIYSQSDFPMELFLLMGDDYVDNPDVGSKCHLKRVSFEIAISGKLRRHIYKKLAEAGIGRDCLVFGRLRSK